MNTTGLIAQLNDTDENVRLCAALNLGEMGAKAAIPALIELLGSKSVIDRRAAACSLGKIGAPEAAAALLKATKDRDAGVRQFASEALGVKRAA